MSDDPYVYPGSGVLKNRFVHPFRDGNGRTQRLYLRQLTHQAGHPIDLTRLTQKPWIDASRAAHSGDYAPMAAALAAALKHPA